MTECAGLRFSVELVGAMMASVCGPSQVKHGGTAPVYLAAVLEYMCAELLELAGNEANNLGSPSIGPRHIALAVIGDDELDTMYGRKQGSRRRCVISGWRWCRGPGRSSPR